MSVRMSIRTSAGLAGCLLCAGGALAQSSVTVYGRVDAGLRYVSNTDAQGGSTTSVDNGALSGSRLGFTGTEDLGGGLKAMFTLESGLNPDTGTLAQGGRMFGRQAFVGLSSSFGTVTLGRQMSPIYVIEGWNEPFGFYNLTEPGFIYDNYDGGNRWDNSVKYEFVAGPVTASVITAPGEGTNGRNLGFSVLFASGPVGINGAWVQTKQLDGRKSHQAWTFGGSYVLGSATLYASYLDHRSDLTPQTNKAWALGAAYSVTPQFDVIGGYYRDGQRNADGNKQVTALMGIYHLSKRTDAYVEADHGTLSGGYASNVFDQYGWPTGITKRTSGVVGMRHKF